VGLYFACCEHPDKDGFLFAFVDIWNPEKRRGKLPAHYINLFDAALGSDIPAYRDFEQRSPGTLLKHAKKLEQSFTSMPEIAFHERMNAQRGAFIWRRAPGKNLLDNIPNVFPFRVSASIKESLLNDLSFLRVNKNILKL